MKIYFRFFPIFSCVLPFFALSQNIGIGTTTPADRLTVRSASGGLGITQETADGTVRIGFYTTPAAGAYLQTHTNHDLLFATNNGVAQMVLQKGTGYVGIGTSAPLATLHLRGAGAERLRLDNSAALALNVRNDIVFRTGSFFTGQIRTVGTGTNTARLGFYTGAAASADEMSERMTIGDNGAVGIGTVTPQHPLTFNSVLGDKISFWGGTGSPTVGHYGIGIANTALQLYSAGPNDDIVFGHGRSGAFVENVRMKGNGNVGIGTNNPTAKLQVNGTIRIADGTQGANRVLVSSSDGTANWAGARVFSVDLAPQNHNGGISNYIANFGVNAINTFPSNELIKENNQAVRIIRDIGEGAYEISYQGAAVLPDESSYVVVVIERFGIGNWIPIASQVLGTDFVNFGRRYSTTAFSTIQQVSSTDLVLRVRYYCSGAAASIFGGPSFQIDDSNFTDAGHRNGVLMIKRIR